MKKISPIQIRALAFLLAFVPLTSNVAQGLYFCDSCKIADDFSNPALWTQVGNLVSVTGGAVDYQGAWDGEQRRIYRSIGPVLNQNHTWAAEINFTPIATNTGPFTGHVLISLTAGNQESYSNCPDIPCTGYPSPVQDAVICSFTTPNPTDGNTYFLLTAIDGSTELNASPIMANTLNMTYFIRMERVSPTLVQLRVFVDPAHSIELPGSPATLAIPSTLNGLNTVQHGNVARGSFERALWGKVDNLCLNWEEHPCPGDQEIPCNLVDDDCDGYIDETEMVLQPNGNDGKDAMAHSATLYQNINYGNHENLDAMSWTFQGDPGDVRSFIGFDLSAIPSNATVLSAHLTLTGATTANGSAHSCLSGANESWISRITSNWAENTLVWGNQPAFTTTNQVSVPAICTPNAPLSADVTALVQDMVVDPANSFGFRLALQLESYYRALIFHSSDAVNPADRPKLEIVFSVPCGPCENNIVQNGHFTDGYLPGDLNGGGNQDFWSYIPNSSPQSVIAGCAAPGSILMWGNQVVGEGIWQSVNFTSGNQYDLTFCGAWHAAVQPDVKLRFRATNDPTLIAQYTTYQPCILPDCEEIYLSPILNTTFNTYTAPVWIPQNNYNTLVVTVWNEFAIDDGAYVSWARVDDICISERDSSSVAPELGGKTGKIGLFPNPASDEITLHLDQPCASPLALRVYDMQGKLLETHFVSAGSKQWPLNITDYPQGMYIIELADKNGAFWRGKAVKAE